MIASYNMYDMYTMYIICVHCVDTYTCKHINMDIAILHIIYTCRQVHTHTNGCVTTCNNLVVSLNTMT